jgi:Flp pilus assembly protein CpaB
MRRTTRPIVGRLVPTSRRTYWFVTLVAAALAGSITTTVVARAQSALSSYGTRTSVTVAERALARGHTITDADIARLDFPDGLLPDGWVDSDPIGRVVIDPVVDGEVLVEARLAAPDLAGSGALLETGTRAITIPVSAPLDAIVIGDRVDLLDLDRWVARDAVVIGMTDTSLTVAVDEREAPAVARAVVDGAITPALLSSG